MRIAVYVKLYALHNKSGGELYLHHLLKEFRSNLNSSNLEEDDIIDILLYDSNTNFEEIEYYDDFRLINLKNDNKKILNNYDLVITQLDMTQSVCDYCLYHSKKCMLIIHSYHPPHIPYTKNNDIFTIYNCPLTKKQYMDQNHTNNFNCVIVPYFDFELYNKCYMYEIEEREYITFINPSVSKGAHVVLKLAKYFKNKKFLIVEGGYYLKKQLIKEFKQLPNCHVIGQTNDMLNDVYLKSRIVLQPSDFETWGMVASEAGSMGIPVLINKNSDGLVANMSKLCLGGFSSDDETDYIKYIEMLDDDNIYGIYSFYMTNICENNYRKHKKQVELLFDNWEKIIKS